MADDVIEPAYSHCAADVAIGVFNYAVFTSLALSGLHLALDASSMRYRRFTTTSSRGVIGGSQSHTQRGHSTTVWLPLQLCQLRTALCPPDVLSATVALVSWFGGYRAKAECERRLALRMAEESKQVKELQCPEENPHLHTAHNPLLAMAQPKQVERVRL